MTDVVGPRARILCVDDEPRILEGLDNHLSERWDVTTATSAALGMAALAAAPFALVITDMRMPGIDGARFLSQVRQIHPDTTRILLSGHADLQDAANAVNQGNIFRMLLKPCSSEALIAAAAAGVRHHELLCAERSLLEHTLRGTVDVLTDILGIIHPLAFGRATRVAANVRYALARLALPAPWEIEMAAMLCQLGCVTLDGTAIEEEQAGQLDAGAQVTYRSHAAAAHRMLVRIPRLEGVASIVGHQFGCTTPHAEGGDGVRCGVLQLALDVDRRLQRGSGYADALEAAIPRLAAGPALALAFAGYRTTDVRRVAPVSAQELRAGMVLMADVMSPRGELWMTHGTELTFVAARRLRALGERGLVRQPLLVSVAR